MPGIFKNISNLGGARFRNVSNSGRGLFYSDGYIPPPSETTTTTSTTTTTTTTPGITTTTSTTTTTTTTQPPVSFTLSYSNIDGATACSNYPTVDTTLYYAAPGSTLSNSTTIYSDYNLTTLAPNGYYSNGVDYWTVAASSGILNSQTSCTPTTTTTSTTTTTTTVPPDCVCYWFINETETPGTVTYTPCGGSEITINIGSLGNTRRCVDANATPPSSATITISPCTSTIGCTVDGDCTGCT
jgi:hypothetical protein